MRWVWGSDGASTDALPAVEAQLRVGDAYRAQAGLLADMDHLADVLYNRPTVAATESAPLLAAVR
jgi:hypothetical protein